MSERKERLNEVYEHLHNKCGVHTKAEFADKIQYARAYVSSALNGNEKYLTDKLFRSICEKFPQFNLDYLLTGKGQLLNNEGEEQNANPSPAQPTLDMLELYAQRIRLVDDLRASLKEELAEVRVIREELRQARDDFRNAAHRLQQALFNFNNDHEPTGFMAAETKS
jgi:hypothetical protein